MLSQWRCTACGAALHKYPEQEHDEAIVRCGMCGAKNIVIAIYKIIGQRDEKGFVCFYRGVALNELLGRSSHNMRHPLIQQLFYSIIRILNSGLASRAIFEK